MNEAATSTAVEIGSRWKPYPAYKNSGVEWLGEIPAHWDVKRNKAIFREHNLRSGSGEEELLTVSHITGVTRRSEKTVTMIEAESHEDYKLCEAGDLVINTMWCWMGALGIAWESGMVSPSYNIYRPIEPNLYARYFDYLCRIPVYISELTRYSKGVWKSRLRLYPEEFLLLCTPLPDLVEQHAIAKFLNRETAHIDALITKKERLTELLIEKRSALLSHAVTKGLDPSVPMKDSASHFYPSVPRHWTITRLRDLCRDVADGPHFSPNYVPDGIMFLSARNVKVDRWSLDDAKYITDEDYREFCKRVTPEVGDILYTKGGTTGIARVVDFDCPFHVWVHIAVLKLHKQKVNPYFLAYVLNGTACYSQSQLYTRGATNNDLGLTRMINIVLAMPSIEEQQMITRYLDWETSKIDALITKVHEHIEKLKEYRTALISAAVTGKIDVREEISS